MTASRQKANDGFSLGGGFNPLVKDIENTKNILLKQKLPLKLVIGIGKVSHSISSGGRPRHIHYFYINMIYIYIYIHVVNKSDIDGWWF